MSLTVQDRYIFRPTIGHSLNGSSGSVNGDIQFLCG